ncbi:AAA family ATPase [Streptomyces sp. ACA25]|uniref:AAA family ATPase n=1 Tax=Streptomyces sp. ACA25 TaxID=3022596 RepID=UPI002308355F|nr:AAA family ATPase [Streptomyces sp. ACA25]MDB1088561.1 AAA family ATPase [Streptomyces sp. ACA25]
MPPGPVAVPGGQTADDAERDDVPGTWLRGPRPAPARSRCRTVAALHRIADRVEQGAEPHALLRAIAASSSGGGPATCSSPEHSGPVGQPVRGSDERHFALPAGREQHTLAERLRTSGLVTVQGPPGTGRTLLLANLVTDLLAHGKRVLVTSRSTSALKALEKRLPPPVRELCVSGTGGVAAACRELDGVLRAVVQWQTADPPQAQARRIRQWEQRLTTARAARQSALDTLEALREPETFQHFEGPGDYRGTLREITQRLAEERARLDWLGPVPGPEPMVTAAGLRALRDAARAFTAARRRLAQDVTRVPPAAGLPAPAVFAEAVRAVRDAETAVDGRRAGTPGPGGGLGEALDEVPPGDRLRLTEALEACLTARARADAECGDWVAGLRTEVLAGRTRTLNSRLAACTSALGGAALAHRSLEGAVVTGLEGYRLSTAMGQAWTLYQGLLDGQKLRGPLGLRTGLCKSVGELVETVRVNGRPPEDITAAAAVVHRVTLERHLHDMEEEWGAGAERWQSPVRRLARLREESHVLQVLTALADRLEQLREAASGVPALAALAWQDAGVCSGALRLLRAQTQAGTAEEPRVLLSRLAETLRSCGEAPGGNSPALRRAHRAVADRDPGAYAAAYRELGAVREALRLQAEYEEAHGAVAAVVPGLAGALSASPQDPSWEQRLPDVERAWAWSACRAWIQDVTDPAAEEKQRRLLEEADRDIPVLLAQLAADRARDSCVRRLAEGEAGAPSSRGPGLQACQSVLPAWIMPMHQVVETVPMDEPGRFDVVILDEADRSGPEALLLAWLGAQIVVIGDDRKKSAVTTDREHGDFRRLRNRQLSALPAFRRDLFGPSVGFLDIAKGLDGSGPVEVAGGERHGTTGRRAGAGAGENAARAPEQPESAGTGGGYRRRAAERRRSAGRAPAASAARGIAQEPAPPAGFRTTAWLRRPELEAAQLAFAVRTRVPIEESGATLGEARFLPSLQVPGLPEGPGVELQRGERVIRLRGPEVQALNRAALARHDVPIRVTGRQVGLVQYFRQDSEEARRTGNGLRLLRRALSAGSTATPPRPPGRPSDLAPAAFPGPGGAGATGPAGTSEPVSDR